VAILRDDVLEWIRAFAQVIEENNEYLTNLDREIGDADHGANMNRGFKAVMTKLPTLETGDIPSILKGVGMTLLSSVGGASGPLYSTVFMQLSKTFAGKEQLELADWCAGWEAAEQGVQMRGKAVPGEKNHGGRNAARVGRAERSGCAKPADWRRTAQICGCSS